MDTIASIFERYEAIRHRLPRAVFPATARKIGSLLDIADDVDAFVFDAFGVLNVGNTPIPNAAARLDQLRAAGKSIRILSNAASYNHAGATSKFQRLGMAVQSSEIVTSRDAALATLGPGVWGCIAAPSDTLQDVGRSVVRLEYDRSDYDRVDGVLFLSTEAWTEDRQTMLKLSLDERPRPVAIANADLVAPRENGFSLEPGHYGHLLADGSASSPEFFGKPFPQVYAMIETTLPNVPHERIAMCGDTLHTDILGAAARGWRTVLVTGDGLLAGADAEEYCARSGVIPDWSTVRI